MDVMADFREVKAVWCEGVHCHREFFFSKSFKGVAIEAKPLTNLRSQPARPTKRRNSVWLVGAGKSITADMASGSGLTQSLEMMWPRYSTTRLKK